MKKKLAIYASYLVSLIFIYLTLEGIDYAELGRSLRSFTLDAIVVASFVYLLAFVFRGVRMRLIMDGDVNVGIAISSNLIAYALNNIIPLKGGDIYKIYFLKKRAEVRKSVSTASVLIERMFDLAAVLIVFLTMIYFLNLDVDNWNVKSISIVVIPLLLLFLVMLVFLNKYKHVDIEEKIKFVNKDSLHVFMECWHRLLKHKHFLSVLTLSLLIWLTEGFVFYVILGYESVAVALVWMSALALSFVIPNAPGNIGLFEWVSIIVLTKIGFSEEVSLSMGLVAHAVQFISVSALGLILYILYKRKTL